MFPRYHEAWEKEEVYPDRDKKTKMERMGRHLSGREE
jgi:hypothetical protein